MRRARDDLEPNARLYLPLRFFIEFDDWLVVTADDQQRRASNARQRIARQIGTAAARDHGGGDLGTGGRRDQCGGRARARAEMSNPQVAKTRLSGRPVDRSDDPPPKTRDVEAEFCRVDIDRLLLRCPQVEEER